MVKHLIALMVTALMLGACTPAIVELPDAQLASLQTRVDSFEKAFLTKNYTEVASVTPPAVVNQLATLAGTSPQELRRELTKQMRVTLKQVRLISYGMSVENASFHQTRSGQPYALIPTQTVVGLPNGDKVQSNSHTLAFQDAGKWYLVRVTEGPQVEIFKDAYPDFASIKIPASTTKRLN